MRMWRSMGGRRGLTASCYFCGFGVLFLVYGTLSIINSKGDTASATSNQATLLIEGQDVASFDRRHDTMRHLLFLLPNCTPPAIEQFPHVFSPTQRQHGAVVVCILLGLYAFVGLAIACDDYFVPSLEKISDSLKLKPDVAGATFMAAGSSAPELATAVIGVFIAKDDIGLGAVVGSAVFNILFVVSVCALFAGAVVSLHWWPLVRDSIVYLLCILALCFIIMDEQIFWYESVCLLVLYILYIILMIFNPSIEYIMTSRFYCCPKHGSDCPEEMTSPEKQLNGGHHHVQMTSPAGETESEESGLDCEDRQSLLPSSVQTVNNHCPRRQERSHRERRPVKKDEEEPDRRLVPPEGMGWRVLWFISLPLIFLMFLTIPDTRRPRWRHWFVVTFIMSCVWISAFSYIMVWMITIAGHTFHIPDTVMGLTFIAAGVSVPDAIASLIVVREGQGDMAVSNAIGSNVFDILVCLGLPWFLKTCIVQPNSSIEVYSAGLFYASITLFSTVFFLLISTWLNKWKLTRKYGVILMFAYLLVTALTTLYEVNFFGFVHPPECPTTA